MPGVYSWYYRLELSDRDIQNCQAELEQSTTPQGKQTVIQAFLEKRLFRPYLETPYSVSMQGPLKPSYRGDIHNEFTISASLIDRIVDDPSRLSGLKTLLLKSVPQFASPIYIGVAKVLRDRLLHHKTLIEKFANAAAVESAETPIPDELDPEDIRDHSFAREVAIRQFNTSNLLVCTMPLEVDEHLRYDLENVLNRLNFPLCGRN